MATPPGGWRERAVQRSLRTARERAVSRSERLIEAATELLFETGSMDFTVHDVLGRSGMSLRAFYSHFSGKDELLLAVFEEALGRFVDGLRHDVAAAGGPVEKLRAYITGFFGAGRNSDRRASAALTRFLLTLAQGSPAEVARVLAPQIELLAEILAEGRETGQVRTDVPAAALTMLVTQTLMSAVEMDVLEAHLVGERFGPDELFAFCTGGVTVGAQPSSVMAFSGQLATARRADSS